MSNCGCARVSLLVMPKLSPEPVTQADLIEFLDTESDFAFELRTLECLSGLGFHCSHGGSYEDPVTRKPRQYDIRATRVFPRVLLSLAVECKNLSPSYPLLVMCVPRSKNESFLEVLKSFRPQEHPLNLNPFPPNCKSLRLHQPSAYPEGAPVGKSTTRVGRILDKDRPLTGSDADIFEKWSQAISSAYDPAEEATSFGTQWDTVVNTVILPVLVVPDNTLWSVSYRADGSRAGDPAPTDRCSIYVGHSLTVGDKMRFVNFLISHLEVVTQTGLKELSTTIFSEENLAAEIETARKAQPRP